MKRGNDPIPLKDAAMEMVAGKIIARYEALRKYRQPHEEEWEMIARFMRPHRRGFATSMATPGRNRMAGVYNSEPIAQLASAANMIYSTITNPASAWIVGQPQDVALRSDPAAKDYAERLVAERILPSFRPAVSPFYANVRQFYLDYVAFGNGLMHDELVPGKQRIADRCVSIAETVIAADQDGTLTEVIRKFMLTAEQAVAIYGRKTLPEKIGEWADLGKADKLEFYHAVRERSPGEERGQPFVSTHVCGPERAVVKTGGFRTMPFQHGAYDIDTGEIWGRGAGFVALPSARVLNLMEAAILEAGQRAANAPLLAPDERALRRTMKATPGSILYGGMIGGRPQVAPLNTSTNIGLTLEMARQRIEEIDVAFNAQSTRLAGRTGITPEEALEMQEQRLRALAPNLGQLQTRFLAPKIARRYDLLRQAGQIPPPPPQFGEKGIEIVYTSTTALAEKSAEGVATMRLIGATLQLSQIDPSAPKRISTDDALEVLQGAYGAPARVLVPREIAQQAEAAEREQMAAMQGLGAADQAAGIVQKLAAAQGAGQQAEAA